jgi:hypothetical protein
MMRQITFLAEKNVDDFSGIAVSGKPIGKA